MAINEMTTSWDVGESGIVFPVVGGVITNGLLSWWKHDEGTGAVLGDTIGTDDGNIQGTTADFWANTAPDGSAIGTYTLITEYVDGLESATFDIASGGITIMVAIYLDALAENYWVVKPWNYVIGNPVTTGAMFFIFKESGTTNHIYVTDASVLAATTWYIITLTFTYGTGSSIKIYRNLTDITSGSWTAGDGDASGNTTLDLCLGYWPLASGFAGRMGDVLIYNRQITFSEIAKNYNTLRGRYSL